MAVIQLTAARVRSLVNDPPTAGRVEHWDSLTPGLCLRISPSGQATWSFRYRPRNGSSFQRITLGGANSLTLAEARERARRHRVTVDDGGDPQRDRCAERVASARVLTFGALAERYVEEYAKSRKDSWRNDEGYLRRSGGVWATRPAASISRRDVIDLIDTIKQTAPVSANRTHTVLGRLFSWAVEEELLEASPIVGLKKRVKETARERVLTDPEIRVLWQALTNPTAISVDVADALRWLLLLGQRPGEVSGAIRSEIVGWDDPTGTRWEMPAHRMKGRRPHVVPLPSLAKDILQQALERRADDGDGESIFVNRLSSRARLAKHDLNKSLRRLIKTLPVKGSDADAVQSLQDDLPTPRDLRRTLATGLSRLGVPREDRKAVLAHAESDVHGQHYDRYDRLTEKRSALILWQRHLEIIFR